MSFNPLECGALPYFGMTTCGFASIFFFAGTLKTFDIWTVQFFSGRNTFIDFYEFEHNLPYCVNMCNNTYNNIEII